MLMTVRKCCFEVADVNAICQTVMATTPNIDGGVGHDAIGATDVG